ncbi:MAG: hypothetical protein H7Y03_07645 [Chitinophagaceae bacterium]|nr:hypothetical protein [Chitinophagaceae bacterium]
MAESEIRSKSGILFPRGFFTPKVGPHQTYGFKAGKVYNDSAMLTTTEKILSVDNPQVNYIAAKGVNKDKLYIILMNEQAQKTEMIIRLGERTSAYKNITIKDQAGVTIASKAIQSQIPLVLDSYGLKVMILD